MALATTTKTIGDLDVAPEVGSLVLLDGKQFGERLLPGEDYVDEGFKGCQFRYPNPVRGWEKSYAIAINVSVVGRTIQYKAGQRWVRVLVEWVGDCEASTFSRGMMAV